MDMMLTASIVMMQQFGGGIMGLLMGGHNNEEIQKEYLTRQIYAGVELLGLPEPTNMEELEAVIIQVDKTVYCATKFTEDFYAGYGEFAAKKKSEEQPAEEPQG
jgi:hypothetical protein